jgi:hephaestin
MADATYFIAADEVEWNYAPSDSNLCIKPENNSKSSPSLANFEAATWTTDGLGTTLKKAKFVDYASSSFEQPTPIPAEWEHLGIIGPIIRASVNDTINIVFKNNIDFPVNMVPQGASFLSPPPPPPPPPLPTAIPVPVPLNQE